MLTLKYFISTSNLLFIRFKLLIMLGITITQPNMTLVLSITDKTPTKYVLEPGYQDNKYSISSLSTILAIKQILHLFIFATNLNGPVFSSNNSAIETESDFCPTIFPKHWAHRLWIGDNLDKRKLFDQKNGTSIE